MKTRTIYIAMVLLVAVLTVVGCSSVNNDTDLKVGGDSSQTAGGTSVNNDKDGTGSKENKLSYEEEQRELFIKLNGLWTGDNGDYFNIYEGDNYILEYSVGGNSGEKTPVYFQDGVRAEANRMSITYRGKGDCTEGFEITLAEDGLSFEYGDYVFYKAPEV